MIPLTQSSLPTHLTAFVKPLVINSRQPGRTDQENGWGEATIHTALVVNGCRHLLGLLRTRVGEEFRMSCQSLSMIFPAALHRLNMVLLHLTLDLPSGCWLRACLKPETSHMPLICTPLRELEEDIEPGVGVLSTRLVWLLVSGFESFALQLGR